MMVFVNVCSYVILFTVGFVVIDMARMVLRPSRPVGTRPRVDWEKVYRLEVENFGRTYEHAGAPPDRGEVIEIDGIEHRRTRRSYPLSAYPGAWDQGRNE